MIDPMQLAATPRSFLPEPPTAAVNIGLSLLSRRSNAISDFWRSCAEIRQPTELMAVQLSYWTQLVDDYQAALSEGLTQLAPAAPEGTTAAAEGAAQIA